MFADVEAQANQSYHTIVEALLENNGLYRKMDWYLGIRGKKTLLLCGVVHLVVEQPEAYNDLALRVHTHLTQPPFTRKGSEDVN